MTIGILLLVVIVGWFLLSFGIAYYKNGRSFPDWGDVGMTALGVLLFAILFLLIISLVLIIIRYWNTLL